MTKHDLLLSYQAVCEENEDEFDVLVLAPGVAEERVDISVLDNFLSIKLHPAKNVCKEASDAADNDEEYEECDEYDDEEDVDCEEVCEEKLFEVTDNIGIKFTIPLPFEVEPEKASADMKNGCMYIRLPKSEKAKPKKISIKNQH